jgi:hypothetical protein
MPPTSSTGRSVSSPRTWLIVVGVVALCAGGWGLMEQSPWIDELHTLSTARLGLGAGMLSYMSGNMPPGTALLEWIFSLGGRSLLGARLLSLSAFVLAALVFHATARTLLAPRGALVASLAFATNPLLIWHAQDARPYALLVLFAMLSFAALLRALSGGNRQAIALFASAAAGFTIHIYFGCFAAAMMLHAFWFRREPGGRRALAALVGAGALAVILVVAVAVLSRGTAAGFEKPVNALTIGYALLVFAIGYSFGATIEELHTAHALDAMRPYFPQIAAVIVAYWAVVALGAWITLRERPARFREWAGYLLVPMLLPFGVALVAKHHITFNIRYVLPAVPASFLFLGALAEKVGSMASLVALPMAVQCWGLGALHLDRRHWKEDYLAVAAFIESHSSPGDPVYECPAPLLLGVVVPDRLIEQLTPATLQAPEDARAKHAIYIVNRPWSCDPDGSLRRTLRDDPAVTATEIRGFEVFSR